MTSGVRPPAWVALLRCTSCRFTAIYFIPFWGALVQAGLGTAAWAAFGWLLWFAHSTGTEAVNRLADRKEDAVNRPERTALCEQVGFGRLRAIALVTWGIVGVLDLGALAVRRSATLAALLAGGALVAVAYSYGLRLGRRHYIALFVLQFPLSGTFIIGWALGHPAFDWDQFRDLVVQAGPVLFVAGSSIATLAGVKDLTDIAGDTAAGFHSAWIRYLRSHSTAFVFATVCAPYAALVVVAPAGIVPPRYWLMYVLLPVVLVLAVCFTRARSARELMATRELFYLYWVVLETVALWCYAPQTATLAGAAGAAAWWLFATRYLHWNAGIDRAWLATLRDLLAPRRPTPAAGVPAGWKGSDGP